MFSPRSSPWLTRTAGVAAIGRLPSGWRRRCLARVVLALLAAASVARGQGTNVANEYNVKAAFLYGFSRYVEWPAAAFADVHSPFVIGVLGSNLFSDRLDVIAAAKKIQERPIVVRRFPSLDDYTPCQILFVPKETSPETRAAAIEKSLTIPS